MAEITAPTLAASVRQVATAAEGFAAELNAADGALGDGDLGVTVSRGFLEASSAALPADVGLAFMECAKAFQRVSSSSYGTLVATAFLSAAKATKGRDRVPIAEIPAIVRGALEAMMARGKGSLGDKTVLDSLATVVTALEGVSEGDMLPAAIAAARDVVETFKAKPNKLGRARMFGAGSVGLVDPGQLAFLRIAEALREQNRT
jgi:dihydroxyacetone kinase-like protein